MKRVLGLLAAMALAFAVRMYVGEASGGDHPATAALALGFVLIVSYFAGLLVARSGLPSITGYIIVGVVFGPYVLEWVGGALGVGESLEVLDREAVEGLELLNSVALGLIALTAGGELKLETVKKKFKCISLVLVFHVVVVFVGVGGALWILSGHFEALNTFSEKGLLIPALLLFAVTSLAKSPATTIAVIQESGARGPVTDLAIAVTVAKDVVVITLFTVVFAGSVILARPAEGFDVSVLLGLLWEVAGSILLGLGLGFLVRMYLRHIGAELPVVILGVAFVAVAVSDEIHLSGLLACMVAGFYIENYSNHGEDLIKAIERHSLPVYVVFFTIAGAGLDLEALGRTWGLALALVALRTFFTFFATWIGARLAGEDKTVQRYSGSAFIGQAGVTLGFTILIASKFEALGFGEFGEQVATVIVAAIGINQIIGPILFRVGLKLSGEIPEKSSE